MSAQDNKPNNRVFVGQLSIDVDQAALKEHFAKAGEIFSLKVKKYPKKNIAYAFINYVDESSPQKAIDEFNGKNFNGKDIEVQIAKELVKKSNNNSENRRAKQGRNKKSNNNNNNNNNNNQKENNNNEKELSQTTLFVSNLPFAYDDEKLKQLFEGFKVKAAHTVSRNGRSKGYGFVEFEDEESAKAALEAKNKFNVEDREINVRNAFKYDESVTQKSNSTDTLYVSNLPYKMSDETLNDIFKDYGIVRAYVARTKKGRSKGFGFVVLASEEADAAAKQEKIISEKNQFKVEDREIYVRPAYLSDRADNSENANNDDNNNNDDEPEAKQIALYVSNIPFSVSSDDLANLFKDVKGFQSANVVIAKKSGRSRGYGFVIFDTEESRDAALAVKSDLKVDDRTLSISIARGKKSTNANNANNNNNNNNRRNRNNNSNYNNRRRRATGVPRRRRNNNNNNNNDN